MIWRARHRRLVLLVAALLLLGGAGALLMRAFQDNLVYFVSPTDVAEGRASAAGGSAELRVGGLVEDGSVQREPGSLRVRFALTDQAHRVPVVFEGVLPDLFAAGKGAIAQGRLTADGSLQAREVLAKHDENYTPPPVRDALAQGEAEAARAKAARP